MLKEEHDFDSSDEEDVHNTVGNIPLEWYKDYDHIGYDTSGRKLLKPNVKGAISEFLEKCDNPDKSRIVKDPNTGQDVYISDADVKLIKCLVKGRGLLSLMKEGTDDNESFLSNNEVMETPVGNHPPQKRSFMPSLDEQKKVSKLVHSIKVGNMELPKEKNEDDHDYLNMDFEYWINEFGLGPDDSNNLSDNKFKKLFKNVSNENLQWLDPSYLDDRTKYEKSRKIIHMPPPPPPKTRDSYRPPGEYLLSEEEIKKLKQRFYDPSYNPCKHPNERLPIPKIHTSLRSLGDNGMHLVNLEKATKDAINATRMVVNKVSTTSKMLLENCAPKLNDDMKPYPTDVETTAELKDVILKVSVNYNGNYVAAVGRKALKIYNNKLQLLRNYAIQEQQHQESSIRNPIVSWCSRFPILLLAVGNVLKVINPGIEECSKDVETKITEWYKQSQSKEEDNRMNVDQVNEDEDEPAPKRSKSSLQWNLIPVETNLKRLQKQLSYLEIHFDDPLLEVSWYPAGDYFLTISGKSSKTVSGGTLMLHRLSSCASHVFSNGKSKNRWQIARFSPIKKLPYLYAAEENASSISVFDIAEKKFIKSIELVGRLSVMELHPSEEFMVVGTYEGRLYCYDLGISVRPFKTLNVNKNCIRSISFNRHFPLFSCGTADGSVVVFYLKVYKELERHPDICPVKQFSKLDKPDGDMFSVIFHPTDAFLFCGGKGGVLYRIVPNH